MLTIEIYSYASDVRRRKLPHKMTIASTNNSAQYTVGARTPPACRAVRLPFYA